MSSSHGAALPPGREGPPVVPPGPTLRARYGTTAVRAEIIAPSITAHSRPPFDLLVLLLAYTGIRIGEAMALRRDDVLDYGRLLMIDERKAEPDGRLDYDRPKAHQIRHVVLPDFLAERIRDHVVRHVAPLPKAHLFTNRDGGALRYGSWRRWQFDPAVRAAGLQDVTPHDLRATHGGWVADAHGVMAAARRLGHSNANVTTRHYVRALDGHDAVLAAALEVLWHGRVTGSDEPLEARGVHDDPKENPGDGAREPENKR